MNKFYKFELKGIFNLPYSLAICASSMEEAKINMGKYLKKTKPLFTESAEDILDKELISIYVYTNIERELSVLKKRIYIFSQGECICTDTIKEAIDIYNKERISYNNLEECLFKIEVCKIINLEE